MFQYKGQAQTFENLRPECGRGPIVMKHNALKALDTLSKNAALPW
jgi:hypothetical protein